VRHAVGPDVTRHKTPLESVSRDQIRGPCPEGELTQRGPVCHDGYLVRGNTTFNEMTTKRLCHANDRMGASIEKRLQPDEETQCCAILHCPYSLDRLWP